MKTLQTHSNNIQSNPTTFLTENTESDSIKIIAQLIFSAIRKKQQLQKVGA